MAEHTPGPWHVPEARLMAAAPELLEAAKQLQWVWQQSDRFGDQVPEQAWRDAEEALSRAIARAEGRDG